MRTGFDPAGYRAYVHFKNDRQFDQDTMAARCREIAAQFGSAHVGMNSNYFAFHSKSIDFVTIFGIAALVLAGGYVVIQSIFRISVNDKIQSYGQLRTIGATLRQIRRIVKKESRRLGGILLLVVSSMVLTRSPEQVARLFFPDGDYKIYLSSEQPEEEIMAAGNPLNENLRQEILSVDGVEDVLATRRSLHGKFRTSESAEAGMCDMLTDANRMDVEAAVGIWRHAGRYPQRPFEYGLSEAPCRYGCWGCY